MLRVKQESCLIASRLAKETFVIPQVDIYRINDLCSVSVYCHQSPLTADKILEELVKGSNGETSQEIMKGGSTFISLSINLAVVKQNQLPSQQVLTNCFEGNCNSNAHIFCHTTHKFDAPR